MSSLPRSGSTSAPQRTEHGASEAVEALLTAIRKEYGSLSRQLQQIARYVEQHKDHIGIERIQDVAERCEVYPSAVVRFAKRFGFTGFSEMQRMFRAGLSHQIAPGRSYQARIRELMAAAEGPLSSADIADEFIASAIAGMHEFKRDLHSSTFDDAVALLAQTPTVWIAGSRRSFAVAAYLTYALQHSDKRVELLSGLGGMQEGQLRGVRPGDVLLAVSFSPYAAESLQSARLARAAGARVIAITDSQMSPMAEGSDVVLVVHESSTFGFRSLTNTLCLAQSLFVALTYRMELSANPDAAPASASPSTSSPI